MDSRALRALKLHLIGIRNLIVEVDAKYIKGMLGNPDLVPSASINRWILSILMFHFTLVHVPGIRHGPDGLSRRCPQPGDKPEPEDDFEDWIDEVYGFMHFINWHPADLGKMITAPPITIFLNESAREDSPAPERQEENVTYDIVPRLPKARQADDWLEEVKNWLEMLERPKDMDDTTYKTFMRYCTEFFLHNNKLWHKEANRRHKLVIIQERRLLLIH